MWNEIVYHYQKEEVCMMPLTMVNPGEENVIKKSVEKKRQDDF